MGKDHKKYHLCGANEHGSHERGGSEELEEGCESSLEQNQREETSTGERQHGGGNEGSRGPAELLENESPQDHHDQGGGARSCAEVTLW